MDWEIPTAVSVASLAFLQVHNTYTNSAPSLSILRSAEGASDVHRQQLMDADFQVGILALGLGITVSLLTKKVLPFFLIMAGFALTSWWHHSVLASTPIGDTGESE